MLDYIYHMTLSLIPAITNVITLSLCKQCCYGRDNIFENL